MRFLKRHLAIDLDFVKWMWKDAICRYKKIIILSVLGSKVRLLAQLGALGIIYRYVKALESDRTIEYFGYAIRPRVSLELLGVVSILVFSMFSVSAFSEYASRTYQTKLRRLYEEFCLRRLLVLFSRIPHPSTLIANRMLSEEEMSKNGRTESQYCGWFFSEIVNLVSPVATFLFAAAVLFYISWGFSLIILVLSSVSLVFLIKINSASAETSRLTERHTQTSSQERQKLAKRIQQSVVPIGDTDVLLNSVFSIGALGKYHDAFFTRYRLKQKTRLVINLLTAVSILTILLVTGIGIIYRSINWGIFFAYLVSLQYFLNNMMQVGNIITDVSRLYPQVNRYYKFVNDAEEASDSESDKPHISKITLSVPSLESDQQTIDLEPGMVGFLYHPGPVDRNLAIMLHDHTYVNNEESAPIYWFMQYSDLVGTTLRQIHGLPESVNDDEIREKLFSHLNDHKLQLELFPNCTANSHNGVMNIGLDEIISEERIPEIQEEIIYGLRLIAAVHSERPAIIVSETDYNMMDEITQGGIRNILSDRILIVVSNRNRLPKNTEDMSVFISSNGKRLTGWSSARLLIENPDILDKVPSAILRSRESDEEISQDFEEDENY